MSKAEPYHSDWKKNDKSKIIPNLKTAMPNDKHIIDMVQKVDKTTISRNNSNSPFINNFCVYISKIFRNVVSIFCACF